MQYRILGRTGLHVSEIGYGGGRVKETQEQQPTIDMLHGAMDLGINFFDTAPTYGNGASETVIGKAIRNRRNECIVATKTEARNSKGIIANVEGSLKRLQTDVIDILQFHGGWIPQDDADKILNQEGLETYQKLQKEGKVRFIGFSADGPSGGVSQLISTGAFDVIQVHYNLMYQSTCDSFSGLGVMPEAEAQNMGIILMRSTTSGAFQKLMRLSFPQKMADVNLDSFLLNYVLSNPIVDVALMSLQSVEDIEWTNAVSDNVSARLDLKEVHRR